MEHLISPMQPNNTLLFSGSDQEELFIKNKKKLGDNWEYATKKISYVYNSDGFRTREFKTVDWENSIVMFGCSNVEGVGLAEEDTIPYYLEKAMKIPVVNLGVGGSAIDLACWNSLILYRNYPRPKAVVHMWTGLDRYSNLIQYNPAVLELHGPWTLNRNNYQLFWKERAKFYIFADRELWKSKVPYYEASHFGETASFLNIDSIRLTDRARDLGHPGAYSAKQLAKHIARNLSNQGLKKQ